MLISAARALLPHGLVGPTEIEVEGEHIASVRPATAEVDAGLLCPGFIDVQVNGVGDVDVASADGDAWDRLDDALVAQGVTAWCPTLVTAPLDRYAAPLERIAAARARGGARPAILGAHLEGPFLGGAPGAHPPDLVRAPDLDWLAALPDVVRVITLAPEQAGADDAVALMVQRGMTVSLGHSSATYGEALACIDAGASLVTHLFNGMAALHHRRPGLVGAALSDDRVWCSLIADLVHVHPAVLRAAFAAKGQRAVLVTDAVAWQAERVGRIRVELVDGAPRLADGTLAGSALTMDQAIRNVVDAAGVDLAEALRAAAAAPAALLGESDRGRIAPGARSDLVRLDDRLHVTDVWIGGEQVR